MDEALNDAGVGKAWLESWLDGVASGASTMSQRTLPSIEAHGGIEPAVVAANARGVHLLEVIDDRGVALVAASLHPFKIHC